MDNSILFSIFIILAGCVLLFILAGCVLLFIIRVVSKATDPWESFPDQELLNWYIEKHGTKPWEYLSEAGEIFYESDRELFEKEKLNG